MGRRRLSWGGLYPSGERAASRSRTRRSHVKVRKIDPAAVLKSRGGKRAEQHEEVVKALALLADDAALEITPEQGETATAIRGRFTRVARAEGKSTPASILVPLLLDVKPSS